MSDAHSFATLDLLPQGQAIYGTGVGVVVPQVDAGTITVDGTADEAAWADAQVVNPTANWDGAWSGHPDPDVAATTRLLYSDGVLYAYVEVEDYDVFLDPENPGGSDQILFGVDLVHEAGVTDVQVDDGFAGFVENAPDQGPVTYKIAPGMGITLNWGGSDDNPNADPVAEGWVEGVAFFDETTLVWGVELAILDAAIVPGAEIGFNVGLGSAKEEGIDDRGEATYAFSSWQVCDMDQQPDAFFCGAGGTVMSDAHSFGTLTLEGTPTNIEVRPGGELPSRFVLEQNYPNPFNPVTTIEYGVPRTSNVTLAVYNTLGQLVTTLVDGQQPAGTYHARWNADDLPSGLYLYRLQVDGTVVSTRKMMLVK